MATLTEVRAKVEDAYENRVRPFVVTRQNAYAASHGGRYWQGLLTHNVIPDGEAPEVTPTIGTATPHDQPGEPWPDEVRTASLPMAVRIDAYESPEGNGYTGTVFVRWQNQVWRRTLVFGPATWLAEAWEHVDPNFAFGA